MCFVSNDDLLANEGGVNSSCRQGVNLRRRLTAVAAPVSPAADAVAPRVRAVPSPASVPIRRARPSSPASQAETLYLKGMHQLQRGRVTEAEGLLQQALQIDPGHAFARQALASVWIGEGRSLATEALLQQGLQIAPAQTGWITLLARLQVERGDRQAAIQTLCSGLAGLPATAERHAAPHAFLAALLQQQGEHEEAVTRFTTALRLAPDQGVWWMGLGISLQASGQAQRAAAAYGRALSTAGFPAHLRVFVEQRLQQVSP